MIGMKDYKDLSLRDEFVSIKLKTINFVKEYVFFFFSTRIWI